MDPRTPSEAETTGTLPFTGDGSVPLTEEEPAAPAAAQPDWVAEARSGLTVPGKYLAYEDAGHRVVAPVSREWTRIGRSLSADIRFDDATVSRRHALVVNQADGDEMAIGRHTIHYFDTATVGSGASAPAAVAE
jgi:hypothetical protein